MDYIKKHNYQLILISLVSLILTPVTSEIISVGAGLVGLLNYTFVIFTSFISAERKIPKTTLIIFGFLVLFFVWCEFFSGQGMVSLFRMFASLGLFSTLLYILLCKIINAQIIDLKIILGAIAGYFILGFIGGNLFELMNYFKPQTLTNMGSVEMFVGFDFYYFSFISLVAVGYGDIVPHSQSAKSLSIILGLTGQFYLNIGMALFVGKYLHHSSKNT